MHVYHSGLPPPLGIVYDSHNDLHYWVIFGSQSNVYRYDGNEIKAVYQNLDNPLSLSLDWVASRLFWVENGDTVCVCAHVCVCACGWVGACMCVRVRVSVCVRACVCMHVCTQTTNSTS